MKSLTDIANRLKRHLGRSSLALLETLELAVVKRYRPEIVESLAGAKERGEIEAALNRAYRELGLRHRVTEHDESLALHLIARHLAEAPVDPEAVERFLQEFTIEKSGNDLYGFSTPVELKELMVGLLGVGRGESVYNPCFGIGGFFGTLARHEREIDLYGEEVEGVNRLIAGLSAQFSGLTSCRLERRDVLMDPAWCEKGECHRFDRVVCNPPFDLPLDTEALKRDFRFARYGVPPANASELAFLEHAAATMKKRAVVLLRGALLKRSSAEAKVRTKMAMDGLVEAVVALPGGLIPRWKEEMALVVLSPGNEEVFFLDADVPRYQKRKGRRNTIVRIGELVETVRLKRESSHGVRVPVGDITAQSLSPAHYLAPKRAQSPGVPLSDVAERIFRAQRVETKKVEGTEYLEVGLSDIAQDDYTTGRGTEKRGDMKRIGNFRLREGDILLPLRGSPHAVGIVGKSEGAMVPNAGVIVVRPKRREEAEGLYLFFRSKKGRAVLESLYAESPNRTLNPDALGRIHVQPMDPVKAREIFSEIREKRRSILLLQKDIERTLCNATDPRKSVTS
ncbi:N-6 DNA methylase [Hydrogenimonas sp. SS33]|uniref:N-6 DNA methylase n=1 Tax=Hydrogenimonas leucolamina TaxID=2954236 RepID=UPI00336C149A